MIVMCEVSNDVSSILVTRLFLKELEVIVAYLKQHKLNFYQAGIPFVFRQT